MIDTKLFFNILLLIIIIFLIIYFLFGMILFFKHKFNSLSMYLFLTKDNIDILKEKNNLNYKYLNILIAVQTILVIDILFIFMYIFNNFNDRTINYILIVFLFILRYISNKIIKKYLV
ncbi:magnesium-transporting ATPase (P-type) [Eubacterium multiforme]|uniref:Magnesium-transporting ATPase (P-type) n=1 Tax=Eubacterium multiforme TaxID=83339 RepID=A0ABT9UTN6_9FIRM|nr:magnesium-transporting ATPase (P-type) [Eubacterium multiforme]